MCLQVAFLSFLRSFFLFSKTEMNGWYNWLEIAVSNLIQSVRRCRDDRHREYVEFFLASRSDRYSICTLHLVLAENQERERERGGGERQSHPPIDQHALKTFFSTNQYTQKNDPSVDPIHNTLSYSIHEMHTNGKSVCMFQQNEVLPHVGLMCHSPIADDHLIAHLSFSSRELRAETFSSCTYILFFFPVNIKQTNRPEVICSYLPSTSRTSWSYMKSNL